MKRGQSRRPWQRVVAGPDHRPPTRKVRPKRRYRFASRQALTVDVAGYNELVGPGLPKSPTEDRLMNTLKASLLTSLVAVIVLASADIAMAQYTGRADSPYGPTTSPYLNLLQNNNQFNPVSTYNTLVKPIVDQNNAINRQGSSLNRLQGQVNNGMGAASSGGTTGHSSYFMNYSHYYSRGR